MDSEPAEDEVLSYFRTLSNWGRWGERDGLGTLNHITSDVRREAARLVRLGESVSCAWDLKADSRPDQGSSGFLRHLIQTGQGLRDHDRLDPEYIRKGERQASAREWIGLEFHGRTVTHLDALGHIFWDAKMYNGRPAEWVTSSDGATVNSVIEASGGIFTRGILVDACEFLGRPLGPGDGVGAAELDRILRSCRLQLRQGDALLLRTGAKPSDRSADGSGQPGWRASCLPVIHAAGVALLGADVSQDVVPSGYDTVRFPIHAVAMVAMGMWLLDNCDLDGLSRRCAEADCWEFLFTLNPLRIAGGSGSPVNPVAIL
jgi:hypothetical protein